MNSLPWHRCLALLNLKTLATTHFQQIHAQFITNSHNSPTLYAKLIQLYCSKPSPLSIKISHLLCSRFQPPNLFLFNTLIRCTQPQHSLLLFANWVSKALLLFDDFTYVFVLGSCARFCSLSTLWFGRQIHARVVKHGFMFNVLVPTTLIHFYASNKDVISGRRVFDEMTVRSCVTWNAMLTGYCSKSKKAKDCAFDALVLFREMLVGINGVKPNDTTMICVLSACSQLGVLETGACVHGYIEKTIYLPENDVFIGTGLVDMYSKCGCLDNALLIFRLMREKNVLTWTALATGLAIHGKGNEAMMLLDSMRACGVKPNAVTFTSLFSACCHSGLIEEGLHLFHNMKTKFGVEPCIQHYGCIVDLLGRAGHLKEAYDFIKGIPVKTDAILWRSFLSACHVHGNVVMAEKVGNILLQLQPELTSPDMRGTSEDYVALSNVYASAERWLEVESVRREMKVKKIESEPGCSLVQTIRDYA
ncbi:pentatricopeptide repeat-containing protein At3g18970-like [Pistacia vera]|uniref:pentatricopeptide repeat-containing protein At3g18970-like n=1 Tax=Pistacia vera TaxID=55513 RepID=UPI0012638320|nr:pentatricopeptide repeat-containing protein At3g18970-like [Pistacia vera]